MNRRPAWSWRPTGDEQERRHGEMVPTPSWVKHTFQWGNVGFQVGMYYAARKYGRTMKMQGYVVLNAGSVQMGTTRVLLCVIPYRQEVFIGKANGDLVQLRLGRMKAQLPYRCPEPATCERNELHRWADEVQRLFMDVYCTPAENQVVSRSVAMYHTACRAFVRVTLLEAAAHGYELEAEGLARAACEDWTVKDLCAPGWPSVDHALLFCQALALSHEGAAGLVELAWAIQMRRACHRKVAELIVAEAYRELATLVPGWRSQGACYDWRQDGSIDRVNCAHLARVLSEASVRELPFHVVSGQRLRKAIEQALGDQTELEEEGLPEDGEEEVLVEQVEGGAPRMKGYTPTGPKGPRGPNRRTLERLAREEAERAELEGREREDPYEGEDMDYDEE